MRTLDRFEARELALEVLAQVVDIDAFGIAVVQVQRQGRVVQLPARAHAEAEVARRHHALQQVLRYRLALGVCEAETGPLLLARVFLIMLASQYKAAARLRAKIGRQGEVEEPLLKRGVVFDVGHGGGSFDYTVAEVAIASGAGPDVISSDIHVFSGNSPGMPYLTWVMSKFLNLGYTLEQVVTMATATPARVINKLPKAGTLEVGAPGDVSLLEVVDGPVSFVDTRNNKREGKIHIKPAGAVVAGVAYGRPYQSPFTVR